MAEKIKFGPYEWRILERKGDTALVITEGIIEMGPYHTEEKGVGEDSSYIGATWESSQLRKFLNGKFLEKFSPADKARIVEVTNQNPDNPWYQTQGSTLYIQKALIRDPRGGSPTNDKVFLLSIEEACRYFGDSTARLRNKGFTQIGSGEAAQKKMDPGISLGDTTRISDQNDKNRVAVITPGVIAQFKSKVGKPYAWWLRSPGEADVLAAVVTAAGGVKITGEQIFAIRNEQFNGLRPALWLKM